MENMLVVLIVAWAGVYVIRSFWKGAKEGANCSCGCPSCNNDTACRARERESLEQKNR